MSKNSKRDFDVVVYGAASFVGRLLIRYLMQRHGAAGDLKWALAGRDAAKLTAVANEFGAQDLPTIIVDAQDSAGLAAMAACTSVVVSTVGPYALFGSKLVAACVEQATDYCDLTGETQWMRRMIDAHHDDAVRSGARIVHNCGFDSIPSDMGVWYTQQQAQQDFSEPCSQIKMRVKAARGGASGGTIASMINVMAEIGRDPEVRKILQSPYAVNPPEMRSGPRQPNVVAPTYDEDAKSWLAPFVMAAINTRVVHRSNALQARAWGEDFLYDEAMMMGKGPAGAMRATGLTAGLGSFVALAAIGPTRNLMARYVLPKPGEGPTPEQQENGFYDLRFFGKTAGGKHLVTKVTGDRDPGYASTAKMLGEAAVCLAKDKATTAKTGGFWTPSTAMGAALLERLSEHAGLTFERLDS